jgi:hypothetical protein
MEIPYLTLDQHLFIIYESVQRSRKERPVPGQLLT